VASWADEADKAEVTKKTIPPDQEQENLRVVGLTMTPPSAKEVWKVVEKKKAQSVPQSMVTRSRSPNPA